MLYIPDFHDVGFKLFPFQLQQAKVDAAPRWSMGVVFAPDVA
jgi:hypothetical protein